MKERGGRAERMQREHGHSSTAMGSALKQTKKTPWNTKTMSRKKKNKQTVQLEGAAGKHEEQQKDSLMMPRSTCSAGVIFVHRCFSKKSNAKKFLNSSAMAFYLSDHILLHHTSKEK